MSILDTLAKLRNTAVRFVMSIDWSARNDSATTGRSFKKFDIWVYFRKSAEEISGYIKIWQA